MSTALTAKDYPTRLYLTERIEGDYYHLEATVVEIQPAEAGTGNVIRNCETTRGLFVDDLTVTSQGSPMGAEHRRELYHWETGFHPHHVTHQKAARMVKTFAAIERSMAKTTAQLGRPVTFGQYLGRVALALGAEGFVMRKGPARNGWASYDDDDHRYWGIPDGIDHADYLVRAWVAAGQPVQS